MYTRQIDALEVQKRVLERENVVGADHSEKLTEIEEKITSAKATKEELEAHWEKEKGIVSEIREMQIELEDRREGQEGSGGGGAREVGRARGGAERVAGRAWADARLGRRADRAVR